MTRTRGRSAGDSWVTARPSASASAAVSTSPATPRTPSVPKRRRAMDRRAARLALAELRALAGLLEAGLLALLDARVARQEAAALELRAEVRVGVGERAGDPVAQRAGLAGHAAAVERRDDVHARLVADRLERLADVALQRRAREVGLERAAVDRVAARAGLEDHAGDRALVLAGRRVAGAGGEVDRGLRDRLVLGLLGGLAVL